MFKNIFFLIFLSNILFASIAYEDAKIKEKRKELSVLKAEFDEYYKQQEDKLNKQLDLLNVKLLKIKDEKVRIAQLIKEDKRLLKEIKQEIIKKTIQIYNYMKAKQTAKIFTQMISEHKIQKVYNIMIKLKSEKTVKILGKMSEKNSSRLTQLLLKGEKPNLDNTKGK
jgi:flagellar motility protein MotE (MotC chaperone)